MIGKAAPGYVIGEAGTPQTVSTTFTFQNNYDLIMITTGTAIGHGALGNLYITTKYNNTIITWTGDILCNVKQGDTLYVSVTAGDNNHGGSVEQEWLIYSLIPD